METVPFLSAALLGLATYGEALVQMPYLPNMGTEFTISRLATTERSTGLTDLQVTNNTVELKRAQAFSLSNTYIQAMRKQAMEQAGRAVDATNGSVNLDSGDYGQVFIAPVTVGGQSFDMVVDTGSSDPWLITPSFQCISLDDGSEIAESDCAFGSELYDASDSSTYQALADQNFNISYADGEALEGTLGFETFVMGGITVTKQEFGLVDRAAWSGDGTSSGLVGFAYSTLTSAYAGTDPGADVAGETLIYDTLFTNMWQ
ncbi:putative peptidase A1 family protein, partial [Teratosphaeria destructans]